MSFNNDDYVRCFNLKDAADVKALIKKYAKEFDDTNEVAGVLNGFNYAIDEVEELLNDLREEELYNDNDTLWYAGFDCSRPRKVCIVSSLNVFSRVGGRFFENEVEVLIEEGTGKVFVKAADIYG